jgi:hypothetical protein
MITFLRLGAMDSRPWMTRQMAVHIRPKIGATARRYVASRNSITFPGMIGTKKEDEACFAHLILLTAMT